MKGKQRWAVAPRSGGRHSADDGEATKVEDAQLTSDRTDGMGAESRAVSDDCPRSSDGRGLRCVRLWE